MPEYLSPGVFVEEISSGPRPIEGVGTSTAGFVGMAERGPESVKLLTSWDEYTRWYGTHDPALGFLSYAVQGFFDNGGRRAFLTRVVASGSAGGDAATLAQDDYNGEMTVYAVGRGAWGNNVRYLVQESSAGQYKMIILYHRRGGLTDDETNPLVPSTRSQRGTRQPDVLEVFDNLSVQPGTSNFIESVINASSHLIRVQLTAGTAALTANPRPGSDGADPAPWGLSALEDGADAQIIAGDFDGSSDGVVGGILAAADGNPLLGRGWGLSALELVDDVALLLAPDVGHSNVARHDDLAPVMNSVLDQCELLQDRFAIISTPSGLTDVQAVLPSKPRDTTYGAYYYPWIEVFDPVNNQRLKVPPSGHVTGIIARTDIERGVHKAPANEVVRGALNLEFPVTTGMQDILNPDGIDCIRDFRPDNRGIRLWGARTMSSDGMWKYINVRRLFLYVRESIAEGMQWVVFEPNHEPTWAAVRRTVSNFLLRVWRDGALMGDTAEEAFYVKCDRSTMTEDDILNGRLICEIGIRPTRPAEFVIFRISQKTATAE